jgi:hypothetical protein
MQVDPLLKKTERKRKREKNFKKKEGESMASIIRYPVFATHSSAHCQQFMPSPRALVENVKYPTDRTLWTIVQDSEKRGGPPTAMSAPAYSAKLLKSYLL